MPAPTTSGAGTGALLEHTDSIPAQEEDDRHDPDERGAGLEVTECRENLREGVLLVRLLEGHLPHRIGVVAEDVGDLLEDENDADGGEQSLDHARRKKGRERARAHDAQPELQHSREEHGCQERFEGTPAR